MAPGVLMCASAVVLAKNPEQQQLPRGRLFLHIERCAKYQGSAQLYAAQLLGGGCLPHPKAVGEGSSQRWVTCEYRIQNQTGRHSA